MECGKLTAKLRDAVIVNFIEEGREPKRFKNIDIPDEIKEIEYNDFKFDVQENGAITFKIWFEKGALPAEWPEARERKHRIKKEKVEQAAEEKVEPETEPEAEAGTNSDPESAPVVESDNDTTEGPSTMEVNFNVTGDRRKQLVAALGAYLDIKPKYLAMPTLAFQIGDYNVSKTGVLTGPDDEKILDMLESHGFSIE